MSHEHQHLQEHHNQGRKPLHHDWRFQLAVVVMLVAIVVYVLSGDEMFGLRSKANAPAPAAAPAGK